MGRFESQKNNSPVFFLICAFTAVVLLLVLILTFGRNHSIETGLVAPDSTDEAAHASDMLPDEAVTVPTTETFITSAPVEGLEFPLVLEKSMLTLESLFQFDGFNPDCENQTGSDIASILLNNTSGSYLERGDIALELEDGSIINFVVTDLPAGKTVMVFSQENLTIDSGDICVDVTCDAVFTDSASMQEDLVSVSAAGTLITLQNVSNERIPKLVVYCHSSLGEEYFGGITYKYTVENLEARGYATVDAVDCLLGLTEVTRIGISDGL